MIGRFSYDLEIKTREQNRNNKRTEKERFDWFVEQIQTRVDFGWLSERSAEKLHARRTSRHQPILRFDVMLQHDWPIELCSLHIRVFFGGKTKSTCFDLFIRWLIKQITSTYRNHFSRSYENRSIRIYMDVKKPLAEGYVAEKIPSNTSTEKKKILLRRNYPTLLPIPAVSEIKWSVPKSTAEWPLCMITSQEEISPPNLVSFPNCS